MPSFRYVQFLTIAAFEQEDTEPRPEPQGLHSEVSVTFSIRYIVRAAAVVLSSGLGPI